MTSSHRSQLSKAQFLQAVLGANLKTAVFDFDGTLWPGDAGSGFMDWSIETELLSPAAVAHLRDRHAAYHRGEVGEISICGEMTQIYQGLPESTVRDSAAGYFRQHVQLQFFPSMLRVLKALQQQGTELWAVSSTNTWVIEEGVRELSIPPSRVLAAAVKVHHGIITDELIQVPSDEGKAASLLRAGPVRPDAAFGNSVHDIHMLEMARLPFAVNPSQELATYSLQKGWPLYYPTLSDES